MKQKNDKFRGFNRAARRFLALFSGMILMLNIIAQERTVTGVVTDKNGETLPGVNVTIKGTTTGVVSDVNGKYSIKVPDANAVLVFSFVGFVSQEIKVGDQSSINIVMQEDVREIDQVVVIGYGVQKKSDLTGSVASVSGSSFQGITTTNLVQALQGRAAGVNVISNTGMPGGSVTIQIRGMSSVSGGNPLVVIDGIPGGDINRLNASDIESVEILKDAASQAIYGSNGGNGVIIVTTKKGKAGKYETNVNASYGWQNVARKVEMMNLTDYNRILAELKKPVYTRLDTIKTYDYNDLLFKDDVPVQNYDFSTGGGTEKSNFFISGSYFGQEGVIKKSNYEKLTFRVKSEHSMTEKVKFDQNVSFTNTLTEGFSEWMYTNVYFTPVFPALIMPPTMPPYDENGKWMQTPGGLSNPFVRIDNRNYWSKNVNFDGNAGLTINLFKGLTYTPRVSGGMSINDWQNFSPKYYAQANDFNDVSKLEKSLQRGFSWLVQNVINYNFSIANHNVGLMAGHEASRYWGYNIEGLRQNFKSTLPNLLYFNKALDDTSDVQNVKGGGYEGRRLSYFGRVNYDYGNFLLLQVNVRRDGHSDFGPNNRFGLFKSFSAGLKFTEFEMIRDLNIFSFGKLRVSYGETGQFPRSNWPYFAKILTPDTYMYAFDNQSSVKGAGPVQIANPDIKWEAVVSKGIGVDLGFLRDQLMVSIDYFDKENQGMLNYQDVSWIAGTYQYQRNGGAEGGPSQPEVNYGSVVNKGVEFSMSYKKSTGDLKYIMDLSLTYVDNEITELATDSIVKGSVHNELQGVTIQKIGHPIGAFWGYQVGSIIKPDDPKAYYAKSKRDVYFYTNDKGDTLWLPTAKPGDVKWKDINNDGKIDNDDRTFIGNPHAPLIFSFSINLSYKAFDFTALFNGVYGNEIFNGSGRYFYDWNDRPSNRSAKFANRYRDPFTDKQDNLILDDAGNPIDPGNTVDFTLPRMGAQNYGRSSDIYIEDGSYLRLKNIQLGYTLPNTLTQRMGIQKLRLYTSLTNVFTLTKYTGFDPEVARYDFEDPSILGIDIGGYPKTRVFSLGLNLTF